MKNIIKILMVLSIAIISGMQANAQVSLNISVRTAPPPLPVYDQPFCPGDGYIWVPGYWAYGDNDYYWVPGTWVRPPQYGLYWTPAYWGFSSGYYGFHRGYWGHHVGFYGGINYGYGYGGSGYGGGMWSGNTFRYNTAVTHINPTVVHNTYINKTVINNTTVVNNRSSFNGQGGVMAKPTPQEQQAQKEPHVQPTHDQVMHETSARSDRSQFASANHGQPAKLAVSQVNNNPQTHTAQANNAVKPDQAQNQQAQNNNLHNNNKLTPVHPNTHTKTIQPATSNPAPNNISTPEKQPDVSSQAQPVNKSMSANHTHSNQGQMKTHQMNVQKHQSQPHSGNMQRSHNAGKSQKR